MKYIMGIRSYFSWLSYVSWTLCSIAVLLCHAIKTALCVCIYIDYFVQNNFDDFLKTLLRSFEISTFLPFSLSLIKYETFSIKMPGFLAKEDLRYLQPGLALTIYWEPVCFVGVLTVLPYRVVVTIKTLSLVVFWNPWKQSSVGSYWSVGRPLG